MLLATLQCAGLLLGSPAIVARRAPVAALSATDSAFGASHTSFYTDAVNAAEKGKERGEG
eukprot:scaffold48472_cov24-Tisochrysis_lutea.AAC.1